MPEPLARQAIMNAPITEPGMLQALVHLTGTEDAHVAGYGLLAVSSLAQSASSADRTTFLQLLGAIPLEALCETGQPPLQLACARLFYHLGRDDGGIWGGEDSINRTAR